MDTKSAKQLVILGTVLFVISIGGGMLGLLELWASFIGVYTAGFYTGYGMRFLQKQKPPEPFGPSG